MHFLYLVLVPGLILGNFSDYQPPVYSGRAVVIIWFCPLSTYNFSGCYYYIEEEDGCSSYGGDAVVTCHIRKKTTFLIDY